MHNLLSHNNICHWSRTIYSTFVARLATTNSIAPNILFAECQKLKIPEDKWEEFILNEMTNPNKYLNILKNKRKSHKPASKKPSMGIIQEEE